MALLEPGTAWLLSLSAVVLAAGGLWGQWWGEARPGPLPLAPARIWVETQNAAGRVLIPYPPGLSAARLTAGDLRGFTWRGPDPVDRSGRLIRRDADGWDLGPLSGAARLALGERLDIRTAQAGDLELLPDIGPALAARIVKFRDESGPLTRIEDLDRIPGMTRAALDRIRPLIQMEADASSQ